jgi:hypothetical protein
LVRAIENYCESRAGKVQEKGLTGLLISTIAGKPAQVLNYLFIVSPAKRASSLCKTLNKRYELSMTG